MKIVVALLALLALAPPAFAQAVTSTTPIAGVPRWKLVQAADGCWAETGSGAVFADGDTVHAKLLINRDGGLILVASRPEWKRTEARIDFTVRADEGESIPLKGSAAVVMALANVEDYGDVERLRRAQVLVWNLPWGNYRARVEGLGRALDATIACMRKRQPASR